MVSVSEDLLYMLTFKIKYNRSDVYSMHTIMDYNNTQCICDESLFIYVFVIVQIQSHTNPDLEFLKSSNDLD